MTQKQTKRIVFGMVVKEDAGGRRHGSSKTVHALREYDDETVDPICSPRDVALPVEKLSAADVSCKRCLEMRSQWEVHKEMNRDEIIKRCVDDLKMSRQEAEWVADHLYDYAMPDWSEMSWEEIDAMFREGLEMKREMGE